MSGPLTEQDLPVASDDSTPTAEAADVEVSPSRLTEVGGIPVRRALPQRRRRNVGPWCFVDHMGPLHRAGGEAFSVGPHPHLGLQTVTWLIEGEVLHRDSLGSEQPIRPGQLNLMTAGHGVVHAEESLSTSHGGVHGVQLWIAQPEATRHGPPAFEHFDELPQFELAAGKGTVLVGGLAGATSPARRDGEHFGADLDLRAGRSTIALETGFEHAIVALDGLMKLGDDTIGPGTLAYLAPGRAELAFEVPVAARALLLGGEPFSEQLLMWWNFVARNHEEVTLAYRQWRAEDERFGRVDSALARLEPPPPPWLAATER